MRYQADQNVISPAALKRQFKTQGSDIERRFGKDVVAFISKYANISAPGTEIYSTGETFNIEASGSSSLRALINFKRVNDIKEPNMFFRSVNERLVYDGYFIGCLESSAARKRRILNKYPRIISYPYYFLDFILKRIFPKLRLTRKVYSILTRGVNRVTSRAENMGRLAAFGFELIDEREIRYLTYFVCRKVSLPIYNGSENQGFFISLPRVGKDGKLFNVYKFRTMHPYAEYLQGYVHKNHLFADTCKFNDDFRITSWGRFLRKLWIDEQPMWLNFLKREVKLVGVRPLSEQYFSLYPEEFRQRRIKYKPGLIPPFYVDLPKKLEEIIESESKYLDAYDKQAWLTDFKYFFIALYNIIIKKARSA